MGLRELHEKHDVDSATVLIDIDSATFLIDSATVLIDDADYLQAALS